MSNLTILNTAIRQSENLFSLNDLHQVSGSQDKHRPNQFVRLDTTQALVTAIQAEGTATPIKTLRGTQGGTYACKEIVIAYAAWISPQFHLVVLRAFLNQLENSQKNSEIQPLAELPSPCISPAEQQQIQSAVQHTHHRTGLSYQEIYQRIKAKFKVAKYDQLKPEQMRDVLIYLASMPIKQVPSEFETVGFPAPSTVRINDVLPMAIFYRDVGKMIKELHAICEELGKGRKSELLAVLKNYCDNFGERSALVRKVRGVLITQLGQLPQDDQDYLRDFIEL